MNWDIKHGEFVTSHTKSYGICGDYLLVSKECIPGTSSCLTAPENMDTCSSVWGYKLAIDKQFSNVNKVTGVRELPR